MKHLLFFVLALAIAAPACKKTAQPGFATFQLDKPFDLKMNASAQLKGGDLKLTFTAVPEDSRCPKGVSCIWEGQAKVKLEVLSAGQTKSVEFVRKASETGGVSQAAFGYQIDLLEVNPYPVQTGKIKPEDYVVKLSVRKV
ncbi:MAG: hypothetical protein AAB316_22145 [Bacteroidota bacterium]